MSDNPGGFSVGETSEAITISGQGYGLNISRWKPVAELALKGRHAASLLLASGADTLAGSDAQTTLGAPELRREGEAVSVIWRGSSDLWTSKTVELQAWTGGFSYGYSLQGRGKLERAYFFRTRERASIAHHLRLFNPEPNSGLVHYSGERCLPGAICAVCFPESVPTDKRFSGQPDFSTISVGRDKHFHGGNWMFTPAPFCYAAEVAGTWLALGVAAQPGQWMFSEMEYPGAGFGFSLVYDGHLEVNGEWQSPRLVCLTAPDEFAAVDAYCAYLRETGLAPAHGRGPEQSWWREPIFCGWGEQISQEVHAGGTLTAFDLANQDNYERWLQTLAARGINPGTVVIDDKWQGSYGLNDVDEAKWPDLPGFIAAQHGQGRRLLLWLRAWSGEGVPSAECMVDGDGQTLCVDPGNPAFRDRFAEQVRFMLQDLDADGFKIDFTHTIPRGRRAGPSAGGLWGLELMRQWLKILSDAARAAKPDALVITHTANPYLADLVDALRLNDVAGLANPLASIRPDMSFRARVARIASPYWLLDADNWPCSSRPQWRDYVRAQADASFGIPALYHAERFGWGRADEPLDEEDYQTIRDAWAAYRATL